MRTIRPTITRADREKQGRRRGQPSTPRGPILRKQGETLEQALRRGEHRELLERARELEDDDATLDRFLRDLSDLLEDKR